MQPTFSLCTAPPLSRFDSTSELYATAQRRTILGTIVSSFVIFLFRCRVYDFVYLMEISQVLRERRRSPRGRSGLWEEIDESMESSSSAATAAATVWRRFLPLLLVSSASFIEWIDSRSRTSSCSRSRSWSRSRSNSRPRSWSWPG